MTTKWVIGSKKNLNCLSNRIGVSPEGFGGDRTPLSWKTNYFPRQFSAVNPTTSVGSMNVVHSFVIWRGVWYSPLHLVSSSSRSWENVMQVVPSEGDIRFSPVQTDIFRWVQKTGSSQLICALCTPADFLCCQQTHKIEKTSSLFCKVHRLCKINWRRVTPPTNYFIMGKHWLQYIYCYNNYYYIILYYIILYYIILYYIILLLPEMLPAMNSKKGMTSTAPQPAMTKCLTCYKEHLRMQIYSRQPIERPDRSGSRIVSTVYDWRQCPASRCWWHQSTTENKI